MGAPGRADHDPARIAQHVYFSHPASKMRLLGSALSNLHREGNVAWMWVTREDMDRFGAMDEDCEGLVNYALAIEGVEVAIFFRELADHRHRVSLRSEGKVNVATVASHFGGGGHKCASGCSLDEVEERVVEQIRLLGQEFLGTVAQTKADDLSREARSEHPEAGRDVKKK